jgi:excinuclease ABC subunit A
MDMIKIRGAAEHNLKNLNVEINRGQITIITGVSGSGKSTLAFDTVLREAQRRFFYTLSHYSRQFLDLGSKPKIASITGLSPAVGLSQNETRASSRATVGTLSDMNELLGVLFSLYGEQICPEHGFPTVLRKPAELGELLFSEFNGKAVMIVAPIAEKKKGTFKKVATVMQRKGYRAIINGELYSSDDFPSLEKEQKHTLMLVIDHLKIKPESVARLVRAIEAACEEAEGFGGVVVPKEGAAEPYPLVKEFSLRGGCKVCGFSWPKLDSRHFSANSLGACRICKGYGQRRKAEADEEIETEESRLEAAASLCTACHGTGVDIKYEAIKVRGLSFHDMQNSAIADLAAVFAEMSAARSPAVSPAYARVVEEISKGLSRVIDVGLGYLSLSRRVLTLSTGEAQRLRLAGVLGESMREILYILDEPSQGLHPKEVEFVFKTLDRLKQQGNTVILVDHDETMMRRADWIIDLGPSGGAQGGQLMAKFKPEEAAKFTGLSKTAKFLTDALALRGQRGKLMQDHDQQKSHDHAVSVLTIHDAHLHNLKQVTVKIPLGALTVVTGVSGAGKASLILGVLYENLLQMKGHAEPIAEGAGHISSKRSRGFKFCSSIEGAEQIRQILLLDRKPIARAGGSMPITYLDLFTDIRNLYAAMPEAQAAGLSTASFSLSRPGGRCEECKGNGYIELSMRFLPDSKVVCPVCKGDRYGSVIKEIRYAGRSIVDVLAMTIEEAYAHFANHKRIHRKLQNAHELGLGYLKLGQPTSSLSGGEAQRLKLLPILGRTSSDGALIILNEPTAGLHFDDVERLMIKLKALTDQGATAILIENNEDVMSRAHWIVRLGPGAAGQGGEVQFQGTWAGYVSCRL